MLFLVDFDGTLSVNDTVDVMLEKFSDTSWHAIEDEWLAGRISAMACMERQLRLIQADRVVLEQFFQSIQLDASFIPFFKYSSSFARLVIVSDGLDHAIKIALENAEFPDMPVYANQLKFVDQGIEIVWQHRDEACLDGNGVCKCAVARQLKHPKDITVLIGNGKSDNCLAAHVDIVFAKDSLATFCQENQIAYYEFQTFADVLRKIRNLSLSTTDKIAPYCDHSPL